MNFVSIKVDYLHDYFELIQPAEVQVSHDDQLSLQKHVSSMCVRISWISVKFYQNNSISIVCN